MPFIYAIVNKDKEVIYVGSTNNPERRLKEHQWRFLDKTLDIEILREVTESSRFYEEGKYIRRAKEHFETKNMIVKYGSTRIINESKADLSKEIIKLLECLQSAYGSTSIGG